MERKIEKNQETEIVESFACFATAISIANRYSVSRQTIYKILKRNGVDTTKRQYDVSCSACRKVFKRTKARIRYQRNNFCDMDCYSAFLQAGSGVGKYKASRWGTRVARLKVSKLFDLKKGYIVHHEDRNCLNNEINNLIVFACQGDHVRHHRGFDVTPLWEG